MLRKGEREGGRSKGGEGTGMRGEVEEEGWVANEVENHEGGWPGGEGGVEWCQVGWRRGKGGGGGPGEMESLRVEGTETGGGGRE